VTPARISFSTSNYLAKTLNLHSFRQKLAISELDKPFTPNVLSSHNIATLMSSAFHLVFNKVSACRPLARPDSSHNSSYFFLTFGLMFFS
jgi:hypothetical protein